MLILQEPMVGPDKVEDYGRSLGYNQSFKNCNNKICIFWSDQVEFNFIQNKEQQVLCKIASHILPIPLFLTIVYAKCTDQEREEIWNDLRNTATGMQETWGVVGDFNSITNPEEKLGGRPFNLNNNLDFISCIDDCGLQDATWCDHRDPPDTFWKRLDRLLYNSHWFDNYGGNSVTHLSRACSDHAPLLINFINNPINTIKFFKFLNVWSTHQDFLQVVKTN